MPEIGTSGSMSGDLRGAPQPPSVRRRAPAGADAAPARRATVDLQDAACLDRLGDGCGDVAIDALPGTWARCQALRLEQRLVIGLEVGSFRPGHQGYDLLAQVEKVVRLDGKAGRLQPSRWRYRGRRAPPARGTSDPGGRRMAGASACGPRRRWRAQHALGRALGHREALDHVACSAVFGSATCFGLKLLRFCGFARRLRGGSQ